jgi:hypothetical protein
MWAVLNLFFFFGSLAMYTFPSPSTNQKLTQHSNLVYAGIFFFVELAFALIAASYFATADGNTAAAMGLKKAGGAFAFASGMLGYYAVANLMCQAAFFWHFPMGDTSRFFSKKKAGEEKEQ